MVRGWGRWKSKGRGRGSAGRASGGGWWGEREEGVMASGESESRQVLAAQYFSCDTVLSN